MDAAYAPLIHALRHQNEGDDEISVAGLSGVLADRQDANKLQGRDIDPTVPIVNQVYAWDGAAWAPYTILEMVEHGNEWHAPDMALLSDFLDHKARHHSGGSDPLALASIAGVITDAQHGTKTTIPNAHHAKLHAASHTPEGDDELFPATFDLLPDVDLTRDLGDPTHHWTLVFAAELASLGQDLWVGTLDSHSLYLQTGAISCWELNYLGNLSPTEDNAFDVGSSSYKVRNLFTNLINSWNPNAHKGRHISGGADPFASTDLLEAVVKRLQESSGPTNLLMGSVADGKYLKRSGTNIIGDVPLNTVWVVPTAGTENYQLGCHTGYRINASGETAFMELVIPPDFTSLVSVKLVYIALGTVTSHFILVYTNFAAHGEAYNTHSDSFGWARNTTVNILYSDDISNAFTNIAAGDHVGIECNFQSNTNALILGVRFTYK